MAKLYNRMLAYTCYNCMSHSDGDISSLIVSRRPTVPILLANDNLLHFSCSLRRFSLRLFYLRLTTHPWSALLDRAPTPTRTCLFSALPLALKAYGQGPHSFHFRLPNYRCYFAAPSCLLLVLLPHWHCAEAPGGGVSHRDLRPLLAPCVARTALSPAGLLHAHSL